MKTIIIVILLLTAGCRNSRTITVETTPATSVTTKVDSSVVKPPRLAALPQARISFPEAVRTYEDRLRANTLDVAEIVVESSRMTVRTPVGETVHRLPPAGETKTIRPDSAGRVQEYVEGTPAAERMQVEPEKDESVLDKLGRVLMWSVVLALLILLLLAVVPRVLVR